MRRGVAARMVSALLVEWMDAVNIAVKRVTRDDANITVLESLRVIMAKLKIMYVFSYVQTSACIDVKLQYL
jgi:hypothetical protein